VTAVQIEDTALAERPLRSRIIRDLSITTALEKSRGERGIDPVKSATMAATKSHFDNRGSCNNRGFRHVEVIG